MAAPLSPPNAIMAVDQSTLLPATLFKCKIEVACTLFVQDAKINFQQLRSGQPGALYTCEFGLGAASGWGMAEWGEGESRPLNRAVKLLNDRNIRIWFMAPEALVAQHKSKQVKIAFSRNLIKH